MLHISLFSGIGGFDLAAEWMGWTNIVSCEINDFGNKVLEHYWPNAYHHRDVKTLTLETINKELGENWRTDDVILTGGFPCQPYSSAGKRKGKEDERHLWPEMLRVIREIKPKYIVGENVAGLLSWSGGLVFDEVHTDLEAEGYEVQAVVIPAAAVNAPHGRDRVWFVAHTKSARTRSDIGGVRSVLERCDKWQKDDAFIANSNNSRTDIGMPSKREWEKGDSIGRFTQFEPWQTGRDGDATDTNSRGLEGPAEVRWDSIDVERESKSWTATNTNCTNNKAWTQRKILGQSNREKTNGYSNVECGNKWQNFPTVSPVHIGDDGLSNRLDGIAFPKWRKESIKAAGNAVVPQVVYEIFKAIEATRK